MASAAANSSVDLKAGINFHPEEAMQQLQSHSITLHLQKVGISYWIQLKDLMHCKAFPMHQWSNQGPRKQPSLWLK